MSALFKATRRSASGQKLLRATSLSLMLLLLGCSATPQGPKYVLPTQTQLLTFYEPGVNLSLKILSAGHLNGSRWIFTRNASFDNHSSRPGGIPSTYVAYTTGGQVLEPSHEYDGDLEWAPDWDLENWQHVDGVDPFSGGHELVLVH